ncbi:unnamed protein product [Pieris macdunnoughi]|uniref:Uncharacterized protein n=1 Tax=Pieris macdunnoughi TaxID=345717 RepID=A0A821XT96_9NEOP|nr:unnamed protein product [Pieris macdunnoughi]
MASTSGATSLKRKNGNIIVDPDTLKTIEDAKKPKIHLNSDKKFSCIASIMDMHNEIIKIAFSYRKCGNKHNCRQPHNQHYIYRTQCKLSICQGHQICQYLIKFHKIKKTKATSYQIHYKGKDYSIPNDTKEKIWLAILTRNGLEYKDFEQNDEKSWYGTISRHVFS